MLSEGRWVQMPGMTVWKEFMGPQSSAQSRDDSNIVLK